MRREQKRNQREPQELEKIEKHGMSMASERIAATIGPSYVCGFFAGGFYGLVKEFKKPKPKTRHPLRITIHQYINNVGKSSTYFGNNIGGAILMYILVGKGVNFLFLEELEDFSVPVQNAFNGALTGQDPWRWYPNSAQRCSLGQPASWPMSGLAGWDPGSQIPDFQTPGRGEEGQPAWL